MEQDETWLAALRTCLRRSGRMDLRPQWCHARGPREVANVLRRAPVSLVVVELESGSWLECLLELERWQGLSANACFVGAWHESIPETLQRSLTAVLLEAGAAYAFRSPRHTAWFPALLERLAESVPEGTDERKRQHGQQPGQSWLTPTVPWPTGWNDRRQSP